MAPASVMRARLVEQSSVQKIKGIIGFVLPILNYSRQAEQLVRSERVESLRRATSSS